MLAFDATVLSIEAFGLKVLFALVLESEVLKLLVEEFFTVRGGIIW